MRAAEPPFSADWGEASDARRAGGASNSTALTAATWVTMDADAALTALRPAIGAVSGAGVFRTGAAVCMLQEGGLPRAGAAGLETVVGLRTWSA